MAGGLRREPRHRRCTCARRFLMTQIQNVPSKWQTEGPYFYSLSKSRKLRGLQANQDYQNSLQKANWTFSTHLKQISLVIWWQPITKSSTKEVHQGTIIDTLLWFKISPLNGYNLIRRRLSESFWSRHRSQKLFIRTIHLNLASLVINYRGIIEQLHLIAQKQTELQNELYDEQKREHQPYYCNLDWMKSGGQIQRNALAICEMSKTSWQTGNPKWTKIWRIIQRTNYTNWRFGWMSPKLRDIGYALIAGEFGKETFWLLILKNWKSWMHQKWIPEDWMQKKSW